MASNLNLRGRFDLDAGPAERTLAAVGTRMRKLSDNSNTTNRTLREMSTTFKNTAAAAKLETDALANLAKAEAAVGTQKARTAAIRTGTKNSTAESEGRQALIDAKKVTEEVRAQGILEETNSRNKSREIRDSIALRKQEVAEARALERAQEAQTQQLASTRYALYDVSRTAAVAGAALLAIPIATAAVAIAWEKEFANVQRTVGLSGDSVKDLREDFVNLAQTVPESWENLTQIGTLAGQLGIAAPQIADFTKTVAMFSTTTGVNVDETATAFGRLNALIPDVRGNYLGLAESVLKVGVNSVATEQQILRISKELSFLGTQTSFSSTQIVGLAGAMASVGISPELSRGVIARAFGVIGRAASDGGDKLFKLAKITGMSADEFKASWSADAGETFKKFMLGVAASGESATEAIRGLGIQGVRDVPALIRLANAADSTGQAGMLITQTFRDAANASGELAKQYEIQAGTISAKIQLLVNNVQALMDAAGSSSLGPIGAVLGFFIEKLQALTDFAQTETGQWIVGIALALTGLAGALGLATAAASAGVAGYAALILALRGVQTAGGGAALTLGGMNTMLAATGPLGVAAARALRLVGAAVKGLTVIGLVSFLPDIANWANTSFDAVVGRSHELDETMKRLTNTAQYGLNQTGLAAAATMSDFGLGFARLVPFQQFIVDIKTAEESLISLANAKSFDALGTELENATKNGKVSLEQLLRTMPDLKEALDTNNVSAHRLVDGTIEFRDAASGAAIGVEELTEAEQEAEEAHKSLTAVFQEGAATFLDVQGTWDSMIEGNKKLAQETADGTDDMSDSWLDYFDKYSVNVDKYLESLQKQVEAQQNWQSNMFKLKEMGASDAVIQELMRMGIEGAPLVDAFVNGTMEQLDTFDAQLQAKAPELFDAITTNLEQATPAFWAAAREAGEGAVAEIVTGLSNGTLTVNQAIKDYNLDLPVDVDMAPATTKLNIWRTAPETLAPPLLRIDADPEPAKAKVTDIETFIYSKYPALKIDGDNKDANAKVQDTKNKAGLGADLPIRAATSGASTDLDNFRYREGQKGVTIPVYTKVVDSLQAIRDSVKGPGGHDGGYFGYRKGGFTGAGGEWQEAGPVHKGEFVMTKKATQRIGVQNLYDLMHRAQRGYQSGGEVAGVTQGSASFTSRTTSGTSGYTLATLDAQSIQALVNAIAASPTFLYTTDRLIAESAARGAEGQTQIGTN